MFLFRSNFTKLQGLFNLLIAGFQFMRLGQEGRGLLVLMHGMQGQSLSKHGLAIVGIECQGRLCISLGFFVLSQFQKANGVIGIRNIAWKQQRRRR
jgi:hypothetical protein